MLIIYRSYGGENMKGRPSYYSKSLCLLSLLRAAEAEPSTRLIFMNDGPMPEDRLRLMQQAGPVTTLDSVGMRRSYVAGLRLGWSADDVAPDDVVFFSEDDYLYRPEAMTALAAAGRALPGDYFALYGTTSGHPVSADPRGLWTPRGWDEVGPYDAAGQKWLRGVSTASTFGARRRSLSRDRSVFLQAMLPHRRSYRDHDTCLVYQGYSPHEWGDIGRELLLQGDQDFSARLKDAYIAPFKAALNIRSHRFPKRRRLLLTAQPNLATHVEEGWIAPDVDWAIVAKETTLWAEERGLMVGSE